MFIVCMTETVIHKHTLSLQVHNYNDAQCVFLWIQIKLMATDEHLKVVHEEAVRFDSDLPQYK